MPLLSALHCKDSAFCTGQGQGPPAPHICLGCQILLTLPTYCPLMLLISVPPWGKPFLTFVTKAKPSPGCSHCSRDLPAQHLYQLILYINLSDRYVSVHCCLAGIKPEKVRPYLCAFLWSSVLSEILFNENELDMTAWLESDGLRI